MNDTVARIVEIMFQDVEMNDEVTAIHDEVMNNCQERYEDMIARGMSEDDAIAAVIDSLKGMEEVIAQYPKKNACNIDEVHFGDSDEDDDDDDTAGSSEYVYYDGSVQDIELTLVNEDVNVERSMDRNVHVSIQGDDVRAVKVSLKGSKLKIERNPDYQRVKKEEPTFTAQGSMEVDGLNIDMDKLSGLESIGRMLGKLLKNFKFSVNVNNVVDSVTIAVPDGWQGRMNLLTTSGDISVEEIDCRDLRTVSTSGDVKVNLDEHAYNAKAELITTSGDISGTLFTDVLTVRSTSGDVEIEGRIRTLNVSTVSGDIDVRADVESLVFKAISGDVDCTFDSAELRSVNGSTISGDVDIRLPSGIGCMAITTHTLSGDVTTHCSTNGCGPTVSGSITTTNGDIDIR